MSDDYKIKCRNCQEYLAHDYEYGFCTKYKEQRKQDNNCITNESWFNKRDDAE